VDQMFYAALMIGLLGSTHCVGMCGGIVGALTTGFERTSPSAPPPALRRAQLQIGYNAGRIFSYVSAGALVGLIGAQAAQIEVGGLGTTIMIGKLIAGLFMIALGLYLGGWWQIIAVLEAAGGKLWRHIEPLGRRFLPARSPLQAFGLGLVWGWLPCGLVYSTLMLALASTSPADGALIMLGFGLGTLPVLLTLGNFAGNLSQWLQRPLTRRLAGGAIIIFGLYACLMALQGGGH